MQQLLHQCRIRFNQTVKRSSDAQANDRLTRNFGRTSRTAVVAPLRSSPPAGVSGRSCDDVAASTLVFSYWLPAAAPQQVAALQKLPVPSYRQKARQLFR